MATNATEPLRKLVAEALPERPFRVELWDGSALPASNGREALTFTVRSPLALGHILRAPGQLGVGRAYVSGALDVDSVDGALELLDEWSPPPIDTKTQAKLAAAAVRAGALKQIPHAPHAELRPKGRRHSIARDRRSVTHHYDVSNEFFEIFLGPSMTYSCAIFSRGASTLEEAQETKLELVCQKLALRPGMRVLDVGCGWGSFAVHAATRHGVHVTGITLSEPQAERARQRAREAGVADQVEIRVQDYRELGAVQYDAVSSIGMVEHVGSVNIDAYMRLMAASLVPGGRLLNHGIARLRHGESEAGAFSERFVFPDAAPLHLSRIQYATEGAGLETMHTEGFRLDYAETLRHWARRLDDNHERALELAGPERLRVWRLYLRAARRGFETGFTSVYQVRAHKPA
jgi:cyclopropane-fatty-acyl-phospholipid synthase